MIKIKLNDMSFYGDQSSSKYHKSKYIEWDRTTGTGPLVFFTDSCLAMVEMPCYKESYKIAWLIEPSVIRSDTYKYILENHDKFNLVFSHHTELLQKIPNGKWYPGTMSWVAIEDWQQYNKSKNISIIASNKNYAVGHVLRHKFIEAANGLIDIYGSGYNPIQHKILALKDYRYSVAIENSLVDNYFTEKLIDCFATFTVPIYWGSYGIAKIFNMDGIIKLNNKTCSNEYITDLIKNGADYYNRPEVQKALRDNFELAKSFMVGEDYIFESILKPMGIV